jgi:hypothetical protein
MSSPSDQDQLLDQLREAVNAYADKELERIERRSRLLKRLNTRLDDFSVPLESQQVQQVLARIRALGG